MLVSGRVICVRWHFVGRGELPLIEPNLTDLMNEGDFLGGRTTKLLSLSSLPKIFPGKSLNSQSPWKKWMVAKDVKFAFPIGGFFAKLFQGVNSLLILREGTKNFNTWDVFCIIGANTLIQIPTDQGDQPAATGHYKLIVDLFNRANVQILLTYN